MDENDLLSGSEKLFESWISSRENSSHARLTREAAQPYRYIWKTWNEWLCSRYPDVPSEHYRCAVPGDLEAFLNEAPEPASQRLSKKDASPVTKYRYFNLINELYDHAVFFGILPVNLVRGAIPPITPSERDNSGAILPVAILVWLKLLQPDASTDWELRDLAIIKLVLDTGATSGELRSLKHTDLSWSLLTPGAGEVTLAGDRSSQHRKLPFTATTGHAIKRWMQASAQRKHFGEYLFFTERNSQMTRKAVFTSTSKLIMHAMTATGLDNAPHIGPNVLRNSVIVQWLRNGVDEDTASAWAGYKDLTSLRHLRIHVGS